jgi:hypothetical protein
VEPQDVISVEAQPILGDLAQVNAPINDAPVSRVASHQWAEPVESTIARHRSARA